MNPAAATTTAAVRERIVFGFNTFYGDLLASVAKSDDLLKKRLKKNYRVLDRKSDGYLVDFHRSAADLDTLGHIFDDGCEEDDSVANLQVARGLRYKEISPAEFPTVRLLGAFAWLFGELCAASAEDDGEDRDSAVVAVNELFERLIESVSRIQGGLSWGSALEGMVDDEARDVFRSTLSKLAETSRGNAAEASRGIAAGGEPAVGDGAAGADIASRLNDMDVDAMTNAFDMMKCSKLGSIVQQISESIDKDQLRQAVESGDMMGENNMEMMGNLFKQVSGAITGKLQSGELSQEDLLKETTSLMASMKGVM